MGLVDYSDSDSEAEVVAKPAPPTQKPTAGGGKKPFQKVVDRSKPGKIRVNLPGSSSAQDDGNTATNGDEPPAKRARTSKGGAFSGFNSFLPAPKNVGKKPAPLTSSSGSGSGDKKTNAPRPGIHLKTGAAPGFIRSADEYIGDDIYGDEKAVPGGDGGMNLLMPKSQQPTIPAGQKPADEVKLVGKPLMFRPLSVSRKKPTKKATTKSTATTSAPPESSTTTASASALTTPTTQTTAIKVDPPAKKKISLFSTSDEQPQEPEPKDESNSVYEPLIHTDDALETSPADAFAAYDAQYGSLAAQSQATTVSSAASAASNSLDSIASDMNLSATARRELFGRRGAPSTGVAAPKVINFDTEREYAHNEILRASGEQQAHNPLRAIAPGKHNLRQLVSQVHNQREALEESFAKGKAKQNEAAARYGWR
ncbi:mitotic checkpoint regulator, MAD2B-interacting-domain-containing protein [Hypoxylon argillaceum]|nr:mitotic checkpoint regulator, MAD2B-interacting-domain-containing protein [Hypoxylon argillaceum]